jgi:hypothetical protein
MGNPAYDPLNSFGLDEFRNGKIIIPVFDSEMWCIETIYNDNAKKNYTCLVFNNQNKGRNKTSAHSFHST